MQTIVLVEDDPDLRDLITWALEEALPLCTVHAVANGLAFIELLQQQTPDLVLLDVQLPDVNGLFLYKLIRLQADRKSVPIVFVTATPELVREVGLSGSYNCLGKPFELEDLIKQVKTLLGSQLRRDGHAHGKEAAPASMDTARDAHLAGRMA
jgi:DNA-binding response OmpR family regulator